MCKQVRNGVATVEFAIVLPLLTIFVLGTIEISSRYALKQAAASIAYESSKRSSGFNSSVDDTQLNFERMVSSRGIQNVQIEYDPPNSWSRGDRVSATVTIPLDDNLWTPRIFSGTHVSSTVTFVKQ